VGEAVARLQPDKGPDLGPLQDLSRTSLEGAQREPRVAEAMRSWRDCVREMGFDYRNPFAAVSDSRWWVDGSSGATSEEIAVAVADVRCKERTDLVEIWHATEIRIQEEAIQRHSDYFRRLRAAVEEEELTTAKIVIGASPK
jgi:hypothetical protein